MGEAAEKLPESVERPLPEGDPANENGAPSVRLSHAEQDRLRRHCIALCPSNTWLQDERAALLANAEHPKAQLDLMTCPESKDVGSRRYKFNLMPQRPGKRRKFALGF